MVAPCRRRPRGGASLDACLEIAFSRRWWRLVELDGDVTGGFGGAATSLQRGPRGLWVEELSTVVAAVRHAGR